MNRSDAPDKKPVPFAVNGPREAILSTTPTGDNQASYDVGFPAITMLLKSAGGLPPKGEDFNQILYELALNARWNQAGAGYQFDSTFSTGISGYPIGAIVQNSTGDGTWINTTDANTNNPESASVTPLTGWIPLESTGVTTKSGLTNASITLTTLEASRERIILTGALTANINLIVPAWRKKWTVVNNCTGSFSVTIKTTSGTGISIPSGMTAYVVGDGTNILQDSNLLGISGRLLSVRIFTSTGTYTPSSGVKNQKITLVGGGGGGGYAGGSNIGSGGGGGSVAIKLMNITSATIITVGGGGTGGTSTVAATNGGASSVSTISAGGGLAGSFNSSSAGAGGTATNGDVNISGGTGSGGIIIGTSYLGGSGGQCPGYGASPGYVTGPRNGVSGSGYGAGGGGGTNSGNGADGQTGIVIIEEYS